MKKKLAVLVLLWGITKAKPAFSQTGAYNPFDISTDKFRRHFIVQFEHGNKMEVWVTAMSNLDYISNLDSIAKVCLKELSFLKDSATKEFISKQIDYNMDDTGAKKVRIHKYKQNDEYYVLRPGKRSYLVVNQDILEIHGQIPVEWLKQAGVYKRKYYGQYYFSVKLYLNKLENLNDYMDGKLNEKIKILQEHYKDNWRIQEDGLVQLRGHPEITATMDKGSTSALPFFRLRKSVEIQNYQNYFIPSISAMPIFSWDEDFVRKEIGPSAEAAFSFEKRGDGSLQTHINVFAGIMYNVLPVKKDRSWLRLYPFISIAYLVSRSGTVFDKNSFRLALGNFSFGNVTTNIQPAIYFNNFLKGVTPSLRIVQKF